MRFEGATLLVLVACCALTEASSIRNRRSVGSAGRYWPYEGFRAIPHRVVRGDAADKPVRTCGLVLVTLTKQICDQECAPPGMMPLQLVDDDPPEPERRKRMGGFPYLPLNSIL